MWVARDKDNDLRFFPKSKPIRTDLYWTTKDNTITSLLDSNLFPDLTWDDEPIEVELEVVPQPIKPDEYFDEGDMIELESMGIGCRVDGGFIYN